ncbi:MAG: prolyl oligopeptidase family serine peptidase [Anaerolineales bacterium]
MPYFHYPPTRTVDQVDNFHGTEVPDPYRWLEDVNADETLEWIRAQNKLTFSYLESIPAREKIKERLTYLWDFPKASAPLKRGKRYFQLRNTGLQNQDVLYVMDDVSGPARELLDPNKLSADGTVALTYWEASKEGRMLAYATSASGSDWLTWKVRNVETGQDLPDLIEWGKFSNATWLPDGSGFYYARYDEPEEGLEYAGVNYYHKLFLHKLGQAQSQDELIYHRPDQKEWGFEPKVSDDGAFLVVHVWQGTDTRNRLFYQELDGDETVHELISELEAGFRFVGNDRHKFYLRSDLEAPRGRLIAINLKRPQRENWETLIPESDDLLEFVRLVNQQFIVLYLHDAYHLIKRFDLNGNLLGEIHLPALGSIVSLNDETSLFGNRDDRELFYTFQSFVTPPTVYRYDFSQDRTQTIFKPTIQFDFAPYNTQQVFVPSKDGTKIPLFLVYKRGLAKNGMNPALLYGYGGFNISMTPIFSISRLVWLEMGGVLAYACLRGGGEYGEDWHQAGMIHNKQNVFDDFISCAEYLIDEKITSTARLAIQGGSNGGLLVGACMTQRPDLFAAALPAVGVMDMLRFHKFTIGWAWVSDYGCSDDTDEFKSLYAYSPLHNLKPGTRYPATLITTADHDDRVVPGHSFKFAAALQSAQAGEAPALIRIQTKAGHGLGKPTAILIEEQADIWSFLVKELDIRPEGITPGDLKS